MKLVVDANIVIATMLKASTTRKMIFDSRLFLYSPVFLLEEINSYKQVLQKKANLIEVEWIELIRMIFQVIKQIDLIHFYQFEEKAKKLMTDKKDWSYLALGIALEVDGIWTNDKGFKNQSVLPVIGTAELIKIIKDL